MALTKGVAMKLILPLGRSVVGVASDVVSWPEETRRGEVTSVTLVAAPGDSLETPPELADIAPVSRVDVNSRGNADDLTPEKGMIVVVNGGTTIQQWAITKWWWQML